MKRMRFAAVIAVPMFLGCVSEGGDVAVDPALLTLFEPLPEWMDSAGNPATSEKIDLGRRLYYETQLSQDGSISCNSCHDLAAFGVDSRATSKGVSGQFGDRNSPSVFNAAGHIAQFWDGRALDVEEQAKGPILNPVEMGMPGAPDVLARLRDMPEYVSAFRAAFPDDPDPLTYDNLGMAIGAFERGLVTPSRWDEFLEGKEDALSPAERAGFVTFVEAGCSACHNGTYLGGNAFQKLGTARPWPHGDDPGRYAVTGEEQDRMVFKVPSLRNIVQTAPYYHSGAVETLDEAVRLMSRHQLGRSLTDEESESILAFLGALTGEIPEDYVAPPRRMGP